jgi:hypothetical protein
MKWGRICAAYVKGSNADKISVRKLERKIEGLRGLKWTALKLILNWV